MTDQAEAAAAQEAMQARLGRRGGRIVHDRISRLLTTIVREELAALTLGRQLGSGRAHRHQRRRRLPRPAGPLA